MLAIDRLRTKISLQCFLQYEARTGPGSGYSLTAETFCIPIELTRQSPMPCFHGKWDTYGTSLTNERPWPVQGYTNNCFRRVAAALQYGVLHDRVTNPCMACSCDRTTTFKDQRPKIALTECDIGPFDSSIGSKGPLACAVASSDSSSDSLCYPWPSASSTTLAERAIFFAQKHRGLETQSNHLLGPWLLWQWRCCPEQGPFRGWNCCEVKVQR
jgi:hypothetical protein